MPREPAAQNKKKPRRDGHRTQWAAQFAVASELCKRGYQVALTLGNHPSVDLMVLSPAGQAFAIDVKGLYTRNAWAISPKTPRDDLYYVLALVPDDGVNRYFVLTQAEVNHEIEEEFMRATVRADAEGRTVANFPGFPFAPVEKYENRWKETLPA
jgi:hypothetical protein